MSEGKPTLEEAKIVELLRDHFGEPVRELTVVQGGEVAQTFSFQAGGQAFILRINASSLAGGFRKEALIAAQIASPAIPIAPILKVGQVEDLAYAISVQMPGKALTALPPAEVGQVLPDLFHILHAIHTRDVSPWSGYGVFDESGRGMAASWRSYLASVNREEPPGSFFVGWQELFASSFLEREFFEAVYNFMTGLLDRCPDERWLVHGDYGFGNVLAHQGKVSAVLDWLNAAYGDFVYDIAWLDFWGGGIPFARLIRKQFAAQGMNLADYEARLACCKAYIGLNALRFYAKVGNRDAYQFARQNLKELMSTFASTP